MNPIYITAPDVQGEPIHGALAFNLRAVKRRCFRRERTLGRGGEEAAAAITATAAAAAEAKKMCGI